MNLKEFLNTPVRRMVARNIALAVVVGIVLLYVSLHDSRRLYGETIMFSTMSTVGTVNVSHKEKIVVKNALAAAHEAVREVEKTCNIFDPESELSKLNATAADEPFACGDLLWEVLTQARAFWRDSGGAFDVTIDPLMKLWGFHSKRETLPSETEIAEAKQRTGLEKVVFDDEKHTVKFTVPGMSINLGGIAKGYALDCAADALRKAGITVGWIEIGGNILALPKKSGGGKYAAGIRNPFHKDALLGRTTLGDAAISTSGNYERYVVIDGRQYTHIIDPATGLPVSGMDSVTVIAPSGVASDALSTSIFVAGPDAVAGWTKKFPGLRVLVVRGPADKPEILKYGKGWGDIPSELPPQ
jgi:thiamine biosynthesis lipoprotein